MPTPRQGYRAADGKKIPSVTTILKIKDPGALINWAYRTGREHGVLEGQGNPAPSGLYEGSDILAIGTCVHSMCEAWVKGDEPMLVLEKALEEETVNDKATFRAQAASAYSAFEFWCKGTQLEIVDCEVQVISEVHRYGGTLDFIGKLNGKLVLGDFKTSNGVWPEYLCQLAAYAKAYEETTGNKIDGGYHLLRFSKENGDFGHHFYPSLDDDAWPAFLHLRALYDLNEKLKKRAA
jgi:hypothetical protein